MFVRLMTSLLISSLVSLFLGEPLWCLVPPPMIEIEVHINSIPVLYSPVTCIPAEPANIPSTQHYLSRVRPSCSKTFHYPGLMYRLLAVLFVVVSAFDWKMDASSKD